METNVISLGVGKGKTTKLFEVAAYLLQKGSNVLFLAPCTAEQIGGKMYGFSSYCNSKSIYHRTIGVYGTVIIGAQKIKFETVRNAVNGKVPNEWFVNPILIDDLDLLSPKVTKFINKISNYICAYSVTKKEK